MHRELRHELWRVFFLGAAGAMIGRITGSALVGLPVALLLYVLVQLNKLRRLHGWLRRRAAGPIPELGGMWDEVIREVHRADRDSERHKERITGLFDRLQAAASAMPDAMVVLSQRDLIEWANPPAERLLGLHAQRDIGARIVHLVRDPALTAYLEAGDYHQPLVLKGSVEPYVVSVQIIPFGASQKLIIGRDISHLIKLEDMRSHFVADASHELRTPLTVLRGFVETFQDTLGKEDEELSANLALMQEQVERMRRLVDDLLALSRLETTPARVHEEVVDIETLVNGLQSVAQVLSGDRGHRVEVDAQGEDLVGNPEELRSAFTNLIHNAIRHTPAGGLVRVTWATDANGGHLAVRDTGEGIAARHIPFLTERFYRVDSGRSRATGGTGLGLSIVNEVLIRHDGRLAIESVPGQGSTFTCHFPSSRLVVHAPSSSRSASTV